jgi:hypothetical protein
MNQRIIYPTEDGVSIVIPAPEWLAPEGTQWSAAKQ